MKIFILEDDAERHAIFWEELKDHDITLAKHVEEGMEKFAPPYDLYLLDHDLGNRTYVRSEDTNTGYTFLQQLAVKKAMKGAIVVIHSFNYEGAKRMAQSAEQDGARAVLRVPFGPSLFEVVQRMKTVLMEGEAQIEDA